MSAYLIFNYNIIDRARIDELGPLSLPVVESFGGELCIGSYVKVLENSEFSHMVAYKFPDMSSAESFYNSEENKKITALRNKLIKGSVVLVPGFTPEDQK